MSVHTTFGYDIVGSFLRPQYLLDAREEWKQGNITAQQLKELEDQAITELVAKQKEIGLHAITDGEYRRSSWHLDFMWAFDGVGHERTTEGIPFHGEAAYIDDTFLTGRVSIKKHPFVEHYQFLKQFEDESTVARQTIPAPAQFLFQMITAGNKARTLEIYPTIDELIHDIAHAYQTVIQQLYDAGCRNLQLDDCTWGVCVDPNAAFIFGTNEAGVDRIMEQLLTVNNLALSNRPSDLKVTTHICRGNFHSTWACQGGYEKVASVIFAREDVDAFYLEFDDERSGSFEPLRYVAEGKEVVLGLITTKSPVLESKEYIQNRIQEASKYISLDRLSLSPQCGFASTEEGNRMTEEEEWAKVQLVKDIAITVSRSFE